MHIPDGYLSPATCAALYATATPFWYVALRRLRRKLDAQMVPLLAVFSASAFVIMMFNLPLPGGTSGHAVGVGISAIVLGPWASMITISVALLIQAVFFGDGGITAFGANSFNMAIVGSLVATAVYRLIAIRSELTSARRIFAAALAGYLAINASAFCAAIELGIQPALFHDSAGAPLYFFYPLRIAVPAMMIGHLTFAGMAEAIVSGGVVAYFQRADLTVLGGSAVLKSDRDSPQASSWWRLSRPFWIVLAALLILTPLGLLAGGSAWAEWGAEDFSDPASRTAISRVSSGVAPPTEVPGGMERLASIWTAPMPDYAPPWLRSTVLGYMMSAMIGSGIVIALVLVVGRVLSFTNLQAPGSLDDRLNLNSSELNIDDRALSLPRNENPSVSRGLRRSRRRRRDFLSDTLLGINRRLERALLAEDLAESNGFLQKLDPRTRIVGLGLLLISVVTSRNLFVIAAILLLALLISFYSKIPLRGLVFRTSIAVLIFTGLIALPAIFITPGTILYRIPVLNWPLTAQGVRGMFYLVSRAEVSMMLSLLLIMSTRWTHLLKALSSLRVPTVFVVILGMTHRYIFLMIESAREMLESRQSRLVGRLPAADARRLAVAGAGVLLSRSFELSGEVYSAMQSRGFRGHTETLDEFSMQRVDWFALATFATVAALALIYGRASDSLFG